MYVVRMKEKTEIVKVVAQFTKEIRVPTSLILDPKGTQRVDNSKKVASDIGCPMKYLVRKTKWANLAEMYIGLIKEAVCKDMKDSDSPLRFWDYCAEH